MDATCGATVGSAGAQPEFLDIPIPGNEGGERANEFTRRMSHLVSAEAEHTQKH